MPVLGGRGRGVQYLPSFRPPCSPSATWITKEPRRRNEKWRLHIDVHVRGARQPSSGRTHSEYPALIATVTSASDLAETVTQLHVLASCAAQRSENNDHEITMLCRTASTLRFLKKILEDLSDQETEGSAHQELNVVTDLVSS